MMSAWKVCSSLTNIKSVPVYIDTDHRITSAYHPQSNGLVERMNQTLQNVLLKVVNEHQDNWDDLLDPALFSIRTSRQKSTKYTPFELMFNRYVLRCLPSYMILFSFILLRTCRKATLLLPQSEEEAPMPAKALDDYDVRVEGVMNKMAAVRQKMFLEAAANISDAQKRYKKDYDKKGLKLR